MSRPQLLTTYPDLYRRLLSLLITQIQLKFPSEIIKLLLIMHPIKGESFDTWGCFFCFLFLSIFCDQTFLTPSLGLQFFLLIKCKLFVLNCP